MGEAGNPSSSAVITGAFRALGLKAEQFMTPRKKRRAGSVEADGEIYYYDGNDFLGDSEHISQTLDISCFFQTIEQVEDRSPYTCDK